MESIANLINEVSINNFDVGSEHWVDVTHITNPLSFYVRPTVYRKHLSVLIEHNDLPVSANLHPGSIVIYKSKILQCFVRGRVLFIQNDDESEVSCDLFALDYGCFEKCIPLDELRKILDAGNVPPLAIHCQLADCKPITGNWCNKVVESMKFFIGKERAKMVIRGKCPDSLIVELYNSCPEDIATMLAYDGKSVLGYSENVISRFTSIVSEKHFYTLNEYKVGDVITVRAQSGDSLKNFFVAQLNDYKCYLNERDNFTYYCKTQRNFMAEDVKEEMAVGVLMFTSNKYERALVTEVFVPEERAKVMLVDWGKFVEVPISRLKPMGERFFHWPAIAILCCAEPSQLWDNALHKYLYPGYKFNITIVELGVQYETPHIVKISAILE